MGHYIRTKAEKQILETDEIDEEKLKAINNETRLKILKLLAKKPKYPAKVGKELDIGKQKAYYHFEQLKDADLIEKKKEERKSGGVANFYIPSANAYCLDIGGEGRKTFVPGENKKVRRFLYPIIRKGKINGRIVVGSPEPHGPDQVSATDGHLAGEIAAKLGNYGEINGVTTMLDTEISNQDNYGESMVIIGGVLTNTVTRKFEGKFPVKFTGEEFPYHEIKTPEETYSNPRIGVVAKASNPENPENNIFLIAGVRAEGTHAAVEAFKELEKVVSDYQGGEYYRVVKGLDMDGDGEIDDFEIIE
jgi:DNA-binding transcriptional ArsR family regulator